MVTANLFKKYKTAKDFARIDLTELEEDIRPTGFFRNKAKAIKGFTTELAEKHSGRVPGNLDDLVALPGVGRKTANLVLTVGFGDYGICVDTHVHRISNLWGYVDTKMPDETEFALRKKLPKRHWKTFNDILVTFGQNLCLPVSPWCSRCPVERHCPRIGLKRSR